MLTPGRVALSTPYVLRQPQETVLYALVKEHLDAFLPDARESYAGPLPKLLRADREAQREVSARRPELSSRAA